MPEDTDLEFKSRNEGRMHACGHDAHTAMLSLAGAAAGPAPRRDGRQRGPDVPAGGRGVLRRQGDDRRGTAGRRSRSRLRPSPSTSIPSSRRAWSRRVPVRSWRRRTSSRSSCRGRGATPPCRHDAIDPIPVACEIVQALQTLVTRRIDVFDPVVLTVSQIEAGTTTNVIPESARLLGTLRSTSEQARERAQEGIRRVATQIAAAHQVEPDIVIVNGYPVTVNDAEFSAFARTVTKDLLGADAYLDMPSPLMGAEDFSCVLQKLPGAMVLLGARPAGERASCAGSLEPHDAERGGHAGGDRPERSHRPALPEVAAAVVLDSRRRSLDGADEGCRARLRLQGPGAAPRLQSGEHRRAAKRRAPDGIQRGEIPDPRRQRSVLPDQVQRRGEKLGSLHQAGDLALHRFHGQLGLRLRPGIRRDHLDAHPGVQLHRAQGDQIGRRSGARAPSSGHARTSEETDGIRDPQVQRRRQHLERARSRSTPVPSTARSWDPTAVEGPERVTSSSFPMAGS